MPIAANALAILAKAPVPGMVKTRLVPPLTAAQAAELYRALLLDQLAHLRQIGAAMRYVFYAPVDAATILRDLGGADYAYQAQCAGDLGARMQQVFDELASRGHRHIVLIGGDLPALPLTIVDQAFLLLACPEPRVVLGPSLDGGYYLIGMNRPTPGIFANMSWSHDRVLADTTARLEGLGIGYDLLPAWFDVDTATDLDRLRALQDSESATALSRTLACLEKSGV